MLAPLVKFTDDAAALEKTLRLIQSSCTIAIGLLAGSDDILPWLQARKQIALGRRYFRLLKWYPNWTAAYASFNGAQNGRPLETLLVVTEKTFLGLYFFLEMFTITNAIGITAYEWGPQVQTEADRSWLYAILASILLGLCHLFFPAPAASQKEAKKSQADGKKKKNGKSTDEKKALDEKATPKAQAEAIDKGKIYRQLVIDCCDVFIPGSSIGWIPVGPTVVGTAQFISTVLAGQVIWNRVQAQ